MERKSIEKQSMYYDRTLSHDFASLLEERGVLRWLFDFVKENNDLDFLIGKNDNEEWISIYRGLSSPLQIKRIKSGKITLSADDTYKNMQSDLYAKSYDYNFIVELNSLLSKVRKAPSLTKYYNNEKEGFYQSAFSRQYGINSNANSDFVILDKEVVIGYKNEKTKKEIFGKLQDKYKEMQNSISDKDAKRYGTYKKPIGNELDFLALTQDGNVLLIEYKHGANTSGIYLSPLQIGLYYDIFTKYKNDNSTAFNDAIFSMLEQKQNIGLISPLWKKPETIKDIIPVLMISEYNYRSSAKEKYFEILKFCRTKFGNDFLQNIRTYNYTNSQIQNW
jgi:hypothetical protein